MAEPPLRRLRNCALAIICARPKEATIISSMLKTSTTISGDNVDGVDNGHEFMLGEMKIVTGKATTQKLKFYVTSSLSQGLVPFAISAGALISVLRPRFAIHAGICAGNGNLKNAKKPEEGTITSITDVIVTDEAMSIESGKFTTTSFLPEYKPHHTHVAGLEAFVEANETVPNTEAKVHYGPFLSSSAVRENAPEIFERIRTTVNRKVLALDMEASAFLELCAHYKHANVRTLGVFKGVSDVGDEDKRDDFQKEALRNTGTVLSEWIQHTFRSRTWEADNSAEMGTRLARNYYQNFISHVLNAVSGGIPASEIEGGFKGFSSGEVPSMLIVMPPQNKVTYFAHQGQLQGIVESHGLQDVKVGRPSSREDISSTFPER
ncbi:hypothetical protein PRZ48_004181 [Zasmidium cellare]|uniref:Nucleoside phosphorylase domain-containing protein n=1 Tax=Zasmidium cellare TaxID=395010 RepID=A0ABR0EYH6_ZASCE|nr:hypothetical protein PRZ48_004181 [Zasmidium cellare]